MSLGRDNDTWVRLAGTAKRDGWDVVIDDTVPGWRHTGLYAASLAGRRGPDHRGRRV